MGGQNEVGKIEVEGSIQTLRPLKNEVSHENQVRERGPRTGRVRLGFCYCCWFLWFIWMYLISEFAGVSKYFIYHHHRNQLVTSNPFQHFHPSVWNDQRQHPFILKTLHNSL